MTGQSCSTPPCLLWSARLSRSRPKVSTPWKQEAGQVAGEGGDVTPPPHKHTLVLPSGLPLNEWDASGKSDGYRKTLSVWPAEYPIPLFFLYSLLCSVISGVDSSHAYYTEGETGKVLGHREKPQMIHSSCPPPTPSARQLQAVSSLSMKRNHMQRARGSSKQVGWEVQNLLCAHTHHMHHMYHVVSVWDVLAGPHLSWTPFHAALSPAQTWLGRQRKCASGVSSEAAL